MENKKTYFVKIDGSATEYIRGCISGIIRGATPKEVVYATSKIVKITGWWVFKRKQVVSSICRFEATPEEYATLKEIISNDYPFLCTFSE